VCTAWKTSRSVTFKIFGPRQGSQFAVCGRARKGLFGGVSGRCAAAGCWRRRTERDFSLRGTPFQANLLACEKRPLFPEKVFNVGGVGRVSLNEGVRRLEITGKDRLRRSTSRRAMEHPRFRYITSGERNCWVLRPQVSFEEGLSRTYEWIRDSDESTPAKRRSDWRLVKEKA